MKTVGDLILELQSLPPNLPVLVPRVQVYESAEDFPGIAYDSPVVSRDSAKIECANGSHRTRRVAVISYEGEPREGEG